MSDKTFYEEPRVLDSLVAFEDTSDGELLMTSSQELPDSWLSEVAKQKVDSANHKMGDFYHVAAIPVEVVQDLYNKYGFDVMAKGVTAREILRMLRKHALDKFITTTKTI